MLAKYYFIFLILLFASCGFRGRLTYLPDSSLEKSRIVGGFKDKAFEKIVNPRANILAMYGVKRVICVKQDFPRQWRLETVLSEYRKFNVYELDLDPDSVSVIVFDPPGHDSLFVRSVFYNQRKPGCPFDSTTFMSFKRRPGLNVTSDKPDWLLYKNCCDCLGKHRSEVENPLAEGARPICMDLGYMFPLGINTFEVGIKNQKRRIEKIVNKYQRDKDRQQNLKLQQSKELIPSPNS